ncbi:MAG TPA: glutamate-1-semialdehyde-2,1-aminomutase [Lentisphaeria bacterium]|nr:MAG: glutamate-1-semialdehyde-2,1-aminomutase [Lentisphaerae bacterium GWF2_38_69]HBM16858.1 glutamate-1-semialdehyde-2,1-aminomutase [Lentisphaeria bacterium]
MSRIKSEKIFNKALKYLPGGVNSPVRSFREIGICPPVIARAEGAYLYDVDDNAYLDFCNSWGVHILGHGYPSVLETVKRSLNDGFSYGACSEIEVRMAERVISSFLSMEKVRFVSSGTEAVMSAIRLARAFTGRKKIIKFDGCYHGHSDSLLVNAGSGVSHLPQSSSKGVLSEFVEHTISLPFNDESAIGETFKRYGKDIAAVIVEPIPANMGLILPDEDFLRFLKHLTKSNKALLILDEVITGFRLCNGGVQSLYRVKPDITTLGKIIGGGFPVGAFGARAEIMDMLAPLGSVYQAGTLSGNPIALGAGLAVLTKLSESGFHNNLNAKALNFYEKLEPVLKKHGASLAYSGSMFTIFMRENAPSNYSEAKTSDSKKFADFYIKLLNKGIYLSPSQFETNFVSEVMTEKELDSFIEKASSIKI